MDSHFRDLLRQWNLRPEDAVLARQLNQEIERKGGGLSVNEALNIRAISREIITHFGRTGNPTLYFSSLLSSQDMHSAKICYLIELSIIEAERYINCNPGDLIEEPLDLTQPIFLLMSEFGVFGSRTAPTLPPPDTSCAMCGRSDVPIVGGLCFSEQCGEEAMAAAGPATPHISRPRDDIRVYHAYRENLILCNKQAVDYAALHGVPLHSEEIPRTIANQTAPCPQHSMWCYRLFNQDVFRIAVSIVGCWGDGSRRNRGCQQHRRMCICGTKKQDSSLCNGCLHCLGCGYHGSQCVCANFHYSEVGPRIAIDLHPLGYLCGCGGSGWNSTDYDSTHKCPYHKIASHHPECYERLRYQEMGLPEPDVTECCDPPKATKQSTPNIPPEPFNEDDLPF